MTYNVFVLLLIGVSLAHSALTPKARSTVAVQAFMTKGCPPSQELGPLICKFLQPSMALPNKPQLIEPMTFVPPLVVEKCDAPHLQMEIELPLPMPAKQPVVIPEAPILPPITLPRFPIPILVEKPIPPPVPVVEPCDESLVPDFPVVIPVAPPLPPIEETDPCVDEAVVVEPIVYPQAPELPPFVMPELPVVEPPVVAVPCPENEPAAPVINVPTYVEPLAPVPAHRLPSIRLPEAPLRIEIPTRPIGVILPTVIEEPCITEERVASQPEPVFVPLRSRIHEPVDYAFAEPPQWPILADPCEPDLQPLMNMRRLPPYFLNPPYNHFRNR